MGTSHDEPPPRRDTRGRVVVIDDESATLRIIVRALVNGGYEATGFERAIPALEAILGNPPDVVLTDVHLPDRSGHEVLAVIHAEVPQVAVVLMTGMGTIESAVDAMQGGARDYLVKPLAHTDIAVSAVGRAMEYGRLVARNTYLERRLELTERFGDIVGASKGMRDVFALVESVAQVDTTVLVTGESGTGKELVVRAIHERSRRASRPFVAINCGALSESVLDSELFGHVRGAFTGAVGARRGLFEEAAGGTLFLDEVGELPAATQVRLLRVLQEREVKPVGSNEARKVDARVIAATHRDLAKAVDKGTFRQDLFYRLNVISIQVPPLRERREDVPLLVHHFIRKHAARMGKTVARIDVDALEMLASQPFPGNARELENVIERAMVLAAGDTITRAELPQPVGSTHGLSPAKKVDSAATLPLLEAREAFDRQYLQDVLHRAAGSVSGAARLAGLDRSNFRRMMKRHGLDAELFKDDAS